MDNYQVIISSTAQSDLAECVGFVLNVSKEAAIELANNFFTAADSLSVFPERNPLFEMPKSFPFVIRKLILNKRYIVLYSIENLNVVIYRIIDSRKKFAHLI